MDFISMRNFRFRFCDFDFFMFCSLIVTLRYCYNLMISLGLTDFLPMKENSRTQFLRPVISGPAIKLPYEMSEKAGCQNGSSPKWRPTSNSKTQNLLASQDQRLVLDRSMATKFTKFPRLNSMINDHRYCERK